MLKEILESIKIDFVESGKPTLYKVSGIFSSKGKKKNFIGLYTLGKLGIVYEIFYIEENKKLKTTADIEKVYKQKIVTLPTQYRGCEIKEISDVEVSKKSDISKLVTKEEK